MKAVGYEGKSMTLEVEFQSGEIYQYFEVPAEVFKQLEAAKSKGRYFNAEIRDDYQCLRVGKTRGARSCR
jgi:hypothetical protein